MVEEEKRSAARYLCKLDRLAAWMLFFLMVLYFVSGYGMTKEIIDGKLAESLHNNVLPIIFFVFFIIHVGYATRLALVRWNFWGILGKVLWTFSLLSLVLSFSYLQFIYEPHEDQLTPDSTPESVAEPVGGSEEATNVFNAETLSLYNGQNGNAPYVAVDGVVYDMTGVFENGSHFGHSAGEELTDSFFAKHIKEQITKYPVVGTYQE